MFRPVAMQRLSVVVLERDERAVLRGLGRLGAIHLLRTRAGPDTAPQEPPDRSADLARCDDLTARIDALCHRIGMEEFPEPAAEPVEISLDEADDRVRIIEARAGELLQRQQSLQQRWGQVTALAEQVGAYEGLQLPLDRLDQSSFLHFALGSLPTEHLEDLEGQVGENVVLLPLPEREGRRHVIAVTSRKGRFALEMALEKSGFHRDALAAAEGETAEGLAEAARRERDRVTADLAGLGDALRALGAEAAQPLADMKRLVTGERQIFQAEQQFPHTDATVLLTGWVPAEDVPGVRRQLQELAGGRCVIEVADPDNVPESEIPVLLRHPRLLRPFEMLVAGYGLPAYRELEPTLFVAITFLVMFGMMFGDVGHGAVLALGGIIALVAGRSDKVRDVGILLVFGGGSSIGFGFVYGEYFGLSGWGLWHNPLEGDTMVLLVDAMAIGIGVISLGLILNIVNRFRRGDYVGGFLDKFGVVGAVFYWGTLALGIKYVVFHQKDLHWLEYTLLIILPLVVLALKEPVQYALSRRAGRARHEGEGLLEVTVESFIEVFEAVLGYMANTISFLRLAAYAMSHAAILAATFLMAREVGKATGSAGGVLGVLIIIFGNLMAIALEGVIASVQALRLEYYEFFGKFFSGTGRAFEPFRLSGKERESSSDK